MPSARKAVANDRRPPTGPQGLVGAFRMRAGIGAARWYRHWLRDVQFIAVTGSGGKTTAKELIAGILGSERRGRRSPGYGNVLAVVAKTLLRTTNRDTFCVLEVSGASPGAVAEATRLIRPHIVVVTTVGTDHRSVYHTIEATAAEKRQLLRCAPPGAIAVLNADDPHVIGMAEGFAGKVITFGQSPTALLRAENVRSAWPDRLSFTLHYEGRELPVQTQLCGKHWVSSVLAALGAALAAGMPIERAAKAADTTAPTPGRMSPVPCGAVTFLRDDHKAPLWSMETVFEFLSEAQARRKIAVIGTISDSNKRASRMYPAVAKRALEVADEVIFVGPNARHALRASSEAPPGALHGFATLPEAADHLRNSLQEEDLVLLKGSVYADGLRELILAVSPDDDVHPRRRVPTTTTGAASHAGHG